MLLANHTWGPPSGAPALLVHGAIDSWTTWTRVGPWLAERGWHVIAVDLRGHGGSQVDAATSEPSLVTMAGDLVDTIAALRPDAHGVDLLIGHSLGALVALMCLAEKPSFARRLVLEDPPGESFDFGVAADELREWIGAARSDPAARLREMLDAGGPRATTDEVRAKVAAIAATDPVYVPEVFKGLADLDIIDIAERCPVPALALLGRDKGMSLLKSSRDGRRFSVLSGSDRVRFGSALRRGSIAELDAGHDLHGPVFAEFVARLGDWLGESAPAQARTIV